LHGHDSVCLHRQHCIKGLHALRRRVRGE
jgi:hypothetical protein